MEDAQALCKQPIPGETPLARTALNPLALARQRMSAGDWLHGWERAALQWRQMACRERACCIWQLAAMMWPATGRFFATTTWCEMVACLCDLMLVRLFLRPMSGASCLVFQHDARKGAGDGACQHKSRTLCTAALKPLPSCRMEVIMWQWRTPCLRLLLIWTGIKVISMSVFLSRVVRRRPQLAG